MLLMASNGGPEPSEGAGARTTCPLMNWKNSSTSPDIERM